MPSKSDRQKHWMAMAKAVKAGHVLKGLAPGTMAKLRETAKGLTNKQLDDFSRVAKAPKRTKKG